VTRLAGLAGARAAIRGTGPGHRKAAGTTARSGPRHQRTDDADEALATLYDAHYRGIIQLAAVLTDDIAVAEEIAQAAFAATYAAWRTLRDGDQAVVYLLRAVIRGCRSHRTRSEPASRGAAAASSLATAGDVLMAALRGLPARQREALTLRCLAGLADADVAAAMGTGLSAARRYLLQGMASVQAAADLHS